MGIDNTITKISAELGDRVLGIDRHSDKRAYLEIAPETVIAATQLMYQKFSARFQIATGVDTREGVEVMYHFDAGALPCEISREHDVGASG